MVWNTCSLAFLYVLDNPSTNIRKTSKFWCRENEAHLTCVRFAVYWLESDAFFNATVAVAKGEFGSFYCWIVCLFLRVTVVRCVVVGLFTVLLLWNCWFYIYMNIQSGPRKSSPSSVLHVSLLLYQFLYLRYATDPGYFFVAHPLSRARRKLDCVL